METAALHELVKAIFDYGFTVVVSALAIAGVVVVFRWGMKRIDRNMDKKEERDERLTAATETLAETSKAQHQTLQRQTEILVLMDRDCKERHDQTHKRLDEHGSALTRILTHLFGHDEGKDAQ